MKKEKELCYNCMMRQKILYTYFCYGYLQKFGPATCYRWRKHNKSCFNEYAEIIYSNMTKPPKRKIRGEQTVEYKLHEPQKEEEE